MHIAAGAKAGITMGGAGVIIGSKEDIFLQNGKHPPSSSIETPFPCLYNLPWVLGSYTDIHLLQYMYSRQSRYAEREKASQLMTTGGAFCSL